MDFVVKSLLNFTCFSLMQMLAMRLPLCKAETKTLTRREINAALLCLPLAYFLVQMLASENTNFSSWAIFTLVPFPGLIAAIAGRRFFLWGGLSLLATIGTITLTILLFPPLFSEPHLRQPLPLITVSALLLFISSLMIFYVRFVINQRRKDTAKKEMQTAVSEKRNGIPVTPSPPSCFLKLRT